MRIFNMLLAAGVAPLLIAAQNAPTGAAPAAQQANAEYANKVVCKKFPPATGSRLRPRQICKTQAEWDMRRLEEQDAMERVQGRNMTKGG